jgi:uncharacterized protein (DUF305 family)
VRRRLAGWVVAGVLAAGCAAPDANQPVAGDQTDVWFAQHMVPHLRQTSSILDLARDRITRPELARLAGTIDRQGQANLAQLQEWLDRRGLAPHVHSHQPTDNPRRSDLDRLSRVRGPTFDLVFLQVMTARHRAGRDLAATQARQGGVPEVRQLAQRLLADQQAQMATMQTWWHAWSERRAR